MTVATYSPTQIGYEQGGVWVDTTGPPAGNTRVQVTPPAITGALQYTVAAPRELLFRSLELNLRVAGGGGTGTFEVGLVNDLDEQPFDDTTPNLPSTQNVITVYSADVTFNVLTDYNIPFTLEQSTTSNAIGGWETPGQVLQHSDFQGVIALVLSFTDTLTIFAAANLELTIDQEPFLTGLPTTKRRYSSADWCPRCGTPIFREQLIRDGYTKGLVCSDCWDRDEQRVPPFRPPKEINPR